MKMLVHRTPIVAAEPVPLADVKTYVRFTESDEDALLEAMARTAAAELEHFAQLALLMQTIRVELIDPAPWSRFFSLPIGPVGSDAIVSVTIDGVAFEGFELVSGIRPVLVWPVSFFELTPRRITIEYPAGFGETAADIPDDLTQALLDQTALHFDGRSPLSGKSLTTSPHLARVGARYRGVQT